MYLWSLIGFISLGCTSNPCGGGENMTNPRLQRGFQDIGRALILNIAWDRGTEKGALLPDAYFQSPQVECTLGGTHQNPCPLVSEVKLIKSRVWQVAFDKKKLQPYYGQSISLGFNLPDRRDHIECSHPGMEDSYALRIELSIDKEGATSAQFKQEFRAGAL